MSDPTEIIAATLVKSDRLAHYSWAKPAAAEIMAALAGAGYQIRNDLTQLPANQFATRHPEATQAIASAALGEGEQ